MKGWMWIVLGALGVLSLIVWNNRYKWGLMKPSNGDNDDAKRYVVQPMPSGKFYYCMYNGKNHGYISDSPCEEGSYLVGTTD